MGATDRREAFLAAVNGIVRSLPFLRYLVVACQDKLP